MTGPSQGLYMQRTTNRRKSRTCIYISSGFRSKNPHIRVAQHHSRLRPLIRFVTVVVIVNVVIKAEGTRHSEPLFP
jgi:hypothetical protein